LDGANIPVRRDRTFVFETFGASASLKQLLTKFGFTAENVVAAAKSQIASAWERKMKVGISADHGGFEMKEQLA
jgi:pyruvate dehydrogenase complex dehydrogenase (E1) component